MTIFRQKTQLKRRRMSVYLYDLTDENGGVVRRLHEDGLRDNFAIMEGLSAQACLSQAACIDQFKHLMRDKKTRRE